MVTIRSRSSVGFVAGALTTTAAAAALAASWSAEAAPDRAESTTVPITACRLVDTRPTTRVGPRSTPLGAEETYVVDVHVRGTRCAGKVPRSADGLLLNVTAANTSQPTHLSLWDTGPYPGTSSLNPVPGPAVPNAVTTKLDADGTFRVYNLAGATDVVIDVVGYLSSSTLHDLHRRLEAVEARAPSTNVHPLLDALADEVEALRASAASTHRQLAELSGAGAAREHQLTHLAVTSETMRRLVARLETARPAIWSDREDTGTVTRDPRVVASVDVVAPASGRLVLVSSVQVEEEKAGDAVHCSIGEATTLDPARLQRWESSGTSDGRFGQLSSVDVLSVEKGQQKTISLLCKHVGYSEGANISNSTLLAMFVPG